MAAEFDGPRACNNGQFTVIHFRETVSDNHPVRFIDKFIDTITVSAFETKYKVKCREKRTGSQRCATNAESNSLCNLLTHLFSSKN